MKSPVLIRAEGLSELLSHVNGRNDCEDTFTSCHIHDFWKNRISRAIKKNTSSSPTSGTSGLQPIIPSQLPPAKEYRALPQPTTLVRNDKQIQQTSKLIRKMKWTQEVAPRTCFLTVPFALSLQPPTQNQTSTCSSTTLNSHTTIKILHLCPEKVVQILREEEGHLPE